MRLSRLGLLTIVPALLAAAPPAPVERAAWEPAAPARMPASPVPTLRTGDETPSLRSTPVTSVPVTPVSTVKDYGPQRLSFPDGVAAAFDMPYQTLKGYRPLTLDLYQPRPRNYPLPLLVFVHGGGFGGGDGRHAAGFDDFPAALAALAAQGYVVASVNYRLSGEARFPAALLDVKAAVRWAKSHAAIDTTRVAVWGMGTGGRLAALAGVSCGVPALSANDLPADAPPDCVQAVIDWSGAEARSAAADSDLDNFLGCAPAACPPGLVKLASPLSYISATSPSFLILETGADIAAQDLAAALKAKGVPTELMAFPGTGQMSDPALRRQAMEKVTAFLAGAFPPGPIGAKTALRRGPLY